jgi:periplasmic protein TonB
MDINKILTADFLDIIFEGRNKEYGAYDLRKTYNDRMKKALIGMLVVVLLFGGYNILFGKEKKKETKILVEDMSLEKFKDEKKPEPPPPPPPPPPPEPPKVEITKFTPPKIVKDEEVKDPPPEVAKLEETKIGTINQEGKKDEGITEAPKEVSTGAPAPVVEDYDKLFTSVQIESEFPGGQIAWNKYLERNLNAEVPREAGAPIGKYTVEINFTVDKEGNISDVQAQMANGGDAYGTIDEAIKIIKKGPKWTPGVQNGIKVKSRKKQRVTFLVNED